MVKVMFTVEAQSDFMSLPGGMRGRVCTVITRLWSWPDVSGAKPMRGDLHGYYRVRTGDWRVVFYFAEKDNAVVIVRIANRRDVYEE